MPLPKPCDKCGERIKNRTREQNVCNKCKHKRIRRLKIIAKKYAGRPAGIGNILSEANAKIIRKLI